MAVAKGVIPGAGAKASPNRANMSLALDPKPNELSMSRMKGAERHLEVRTGGSRKYFG